MRLNIVGFLMLLLLEGCVTPRCFQHVMLDQTTPLGFQSVQENFAKGCHVSPAGGVIAPGSFSMKCPCEQVVSGHLLHCSTQ
jgi:hypothetical protein